MRVIEEMKKVVETIKLHQTTFRLNNAVKYLKLN